VAWEKAYWQLAHLVFTAFYIDQGSHPFLSEYFSDFLKTDL
jgi:hypothetical protein